MPAFGLPEHTLTAIRRILADYPQIERAILYGSRAQGTYRTGSDIDLTLVGDRLDLHILGEIAARLEESSIPYQVDLSLWSRLEHVGLREHIERIGVVFYRRGDADGRAVT